MNSSKPSEVAAKSGDGLPEPPPDFIEQDHPELLDNIVPTRGYQMTPMVGLGGSAGSIQALTEFFKAMPSDSGMIFVVILHLSPTHDSNLPDMLGRITSMKVHSAEDGQKVEANNVYVIPPGKHLATVNGHLRLSELQPERGKRVAVDLFFRSLADTHGPHALAVVLSGADGDGAIGIKRIKERGGLTIVQDPDEAEHPSMPRASIHTGMIDWVLGVADIPKRLLEFRDNERKIKLPPEDGPALSPTAKPVADDGEESLRELLVYVRTRTARDFSYYKRATILRRIARRMQVNGVVELPDYLTFLRTHPGEAGALVQDLLISVTNFFRDREAFAALESRIPELFVNKVQTDSVRVWVPACATGEEAYSIAMLLLEHAQTLDSPPTLQVFACDLDDSAIRVARVGRYPDTIATDVNDDRLRRFFVKDHAGYLVRRELREMVLFATHDLLKDPPFGRMDLISCRNLMIYLNREAQERLLKTLVFALRPKGLLFLGSSDSVEDDSRVFEVVDKRHRIYRSNPNGRAGLPVPTGPTSLIRWLETEPTVVHGKRFLQEMPAPAFPDRLGSRLDRAALAELHFRLIERLAPPSVIVDSEHDIAHLSESAGEFLRLTGGEPTTNLTRLAHPMLRVELRSALYRAAESKNTVEVYDVPLDLDGRSWLVNIRVTPAPDVASGFMLVVFEKHEQTGPASNGDKKAAAPPEPLTRHLERELEQLKTRLRDTVEQYEASTEELKASNEELQAMNEELRSATEELETSREELQSINEELTTVNAELKGKVEELASANSDLQNLMASTSIATIFLNRGLEITRFTPAAVEIFHLIPGDIGRPLTDLRNKLEYPQLVEDAAKVLQTLIPIEREVRAEGRWFFARMQPYRTVEDHIAGAVLTLIDVTERNSAVEAMRQSEERLRIVIESIKDHAIFTMDPQRRVNAWNKGAQAVFGYSESEILGESGDILFTPEDRAKGDPAREAQTALKEGRAGNERWHARKDGSMFYGSGSVLPLHGNSGEMLGFVKVMRDLTERKRAEESLRETVDELTRFNAVATGRESRMIELKKEINDLCAKLNLPARYSLDFDRDHGGSSS
ncbi:MAG: chemotaxis protein CheB [Gemmataceae bacterium]